MEELAVSPLVEQDAQDPVDHVQRFAFALLVPEELLPSELLHPPVQMLLLQPRSTLPPDVDQIPGL